MKIKILWMKYMNELNSNLLLKKEGVFCIEICQMPQWMKSQNKSEKMSIQKAQKMTLLNKKTANNP